MGNSIQKKVLGWVNEVNEESMVFVTYGSYLVLFVVFVGVVFYCFGSRFLFWGCRVLGVVGSFVFVVALFWIGMPIEEALAAFYFKKAFLSGGMGKFLEDGQWYSGEVVHVKEEGKSNSPSAVVDDGFDYYVVGEEGGKFVSKWGGSGNSLSPMEGMRALWRDVEKTANVGSKISSLVVVHCELEKSKSSDFLGYEKAFDWFECVRSGVRTGYHGVGCHKEWADLFKYLICDDLYTKGSRPGKALVLMKSEDVPKNPGYDKLVAWYECMRKKCYAGEDGYKGYGSGHPLSLVNTDCGKEWVELSVYLNGADRYKSKSAADLLLESGFSVGGDEGFIWDDDFKKSESSSETSQSSREGESEEAEFEFDPYDEILEEMLLVDKLEEALEAEDSTGLFGSGEKYPIVEEMTVSFSESLESVLVDDTRAAPEVSDVVSETALFVSGEACPTVEEVVVTPSEELGSKFGVEALSEKDTVKETISLVSEEESPSVAKVDTPSESMEPTPVDEKEVVLEESDTVKGDIVSDVKQEKLSTVEESVISSVGVELMSVDDISVTLEEGDVVVKEPVLFVSEEERVTPESGDFFSEQNLKEPDVDVTPFRESGDGGPVDDVIPVVNLEGSLVSMVPVVKGERLSFGGLSVIEEVEEPEELAPSDEVPSSSGLGLGLSSESSSVVREESDTVKGGIVFGGKQEELSAVEESVTSSVGVESVSVDDIRAAPEVSDVVSETALFVSGEACPTVEEVVVTPSEELGSKLMSEVDLGFKESKSDKNVVFAESAEKTLEPMMTGAEAILLSVSEPEGQVKLAGELAPSFRKRMVEMDPRFLLLQEEREFFLGKLGELEVLGSSSKSFCKKLLTFKGKVDSFFTVTSKDMEAELLKSIRDKCGVTDLNILVLQNASWYIDSEAQGIFEACNKAIKGKTKKLQFLEFLDSWEVGQESFVDRASRLPKKVNALKKKMLADYAE